MTPWEIEGREFINCNCVYACPCQFNAYPDKGHCEAIGAVSVDRGHFGDVRLDGTRFGMIMQWPGAVRQVLNERQQPALKPKAMALRLGSAAIDKVNADAFC